MAVEKAGAPVASPENETRIYEQPLNERLRTYLRLDFLYNQALYHNEMASQWGSRAAMSCLLDVLAIATRGDIRSDVLKDLERQLNTLNEFQARPGVDGSRLRTVMSNLMRLRGELLQAGSAFLQPLRESEFLSAIKHRSAIPGGTCEFDLPDYYYWLSQPAEVRTQAFTQWLGMLRQLCDGIAELLWLIRESGHTSDQVATNGSFQHGMVGEGTAGLLRVSLQPGMDLYPEISGSHHRFTIRFMQRPDALLRPTQVNKDVRFRLTIC